MIVARQKLEDEQRSLFEMKMCTVLRRTSGGLNGGDGGEECEWT